MKRKLLVFCFVLLISCKQVSENYTAETPSSQEGVEEINLMDEQKRDVYLRSLMDVETTLVEDEKIENDLLNILQGLKEKDELQKIVPTLQKVNNNLFELSDISFFSADGENIEESIKLSLYKLESGGKSGFAITCNDLRVGEILALVEEGEFNEDDPFIKLISSNIKAYIDKTVQDWYELKNKENEYKQRSVWEGLVTSEKYTYENWKVNKKSSPSFLLKTKWAQGDGYNDVITKLKGGNFPAGCVGVAIAQIVAFHEYPKKYYGTKWESFNTFKGKLVKHFPFAKEWDGKYDWWIMTWPEEIDGIDRDYPIYKLQIASLMYEIAESSNASYSEGATSIYIGDYTRGLLFHDYITGVCNKIPMSKDEADWDKGERIKLPPWLIAKKPILKPFSCIQSDVDNNATKSIGPKGNRVRYTDYSFDSVKSSIDNLCPVLIKGRTVDRKTDPDGKVTFEESGHAWVIDGYCNLTCDAVHKETKEQKTITADYVHCNAGWGGTCNGYYISNVFTFGLNGGANASDNQIRNSWTGFNDHYKYNIKIFPNLIPKSKLGRYSKYPWHYNWEALW